jgi:hypothetical protein
MDEDQGRSELIRRYLLGSTSEDESEQAERLLMTDQREFESARMVKDELADDYVQGLLTQSERSKFEQHILTTEDGRQKAWFASLLSSYAVEAVKQGTLRSPGKWPVRDPVSRLVGSHVGRVALGSACVLVGMLILVTVLLQRVSDLKAKLQEEKQREQASLDESDRLRDNLLARRQEEEALQRRVEELEKPQGTGTVHWELLPGISRGENGLPTVLIPQGAKVIEMDLKVLQDGDRRYRVELYNAGGQRLAMQDMLSVVKRKDALFVPFRYPVEDLRSGVYRIALIAANDQKEGLLLGNYHFRVGR